MTTLEISRQARRRMRIAAGLPTRHPRQIDHVSTAIDQLPEPDTLNAEERAAALTAIARQRNRLDAYLTTLAGHADPKTTRRAYARVQKGRVLRGLAGVLDLGACAGRGDA